MATPSRRASRRQRYWFPRPFPQRLGGVGIGRRHLAIRMVDMGLGCDRDLHSDGRVRSFTAGPLPHHIVEDGELARVVVTLLVLASGPLLIGLVGPLLVVSLGWPLSNYGQDVTAAELWTACLTVGALVIATVGVVVLRDAVGRVVDGDQEPVRKAQGGKESTPLD